MTTTAPSWWAGRRVLVTGHTGFKGAWLTGFLERLGARVTGLALPPEPDGAFEALAPGWSADSHIVDVRDRAGVARVVARSSPEVVFHLAAQALVPRGFADPTGTYETNVLGTAHVLEAAAACPAVAVVLVVTSDKVYENDGAGRPFTESDRLGGRDPYSSSKACAELVVRAWRDSLLPGGRPAVGVARAGNAVGGGDTAGDRLLPDVFRALRAGRAVRLRHPEGRRPWQFVLEPLAGYLAYAEGLAGQPGRMPPALNFGPDPATCVTVREVVDQVFQLWGGGAWVPGDGVGPEPQALALDSSLARQVLGWCPRLDLGTALRWTCEWARCQHEEGELGALFADQVARYQAGSA